MSSLFLGCNSYRSSRFGTGVMADRDTYTQSKQPLDKNQSLKFCQSSVKQSHFQNLKEKGSDFLTIVAL